MDRSIKEQIALMLRYSKEHPDLDRETALELWVTKYGKLFREQYEQRMTTDDSESKDN